jgi:dephospho-CoA kinase
MKILAITGGIASGKNFICDIFKKFNAEIFDADLIVHQLLKNDSEIIQQIAQNFPQSLENSESNQLQISRKNLGKIIFEDAKKRQILEQIIHPKIRQKYQNFIATNLENKTSFAVLNIPLLLESKNYKYDFLIAIKCDLETRKTRFYERYQKQFSQENSTKQQLTKEEIITYFEKILATQTSDEIRFAQADFFIDNNTHNNNTNSTNIEQQIKIILEKIGLIN